MKRFVFLFFLLFIVSLVCSQNVTLNTPKDPGLIKRDIITIGLGFGQDYGGLGGGFLFYPQKNIGVFASLGDAFVPNNAGYNVGLKFRIMADKPTAMVNPYIIAMYGYNAAIVVSNSPSDDKIYYGYTVGAGLDIRSKNIKDGYLTLGISYPFRKPEINDYINQLNKQYNSNISLLPFSISIGYRFIIG